VVELADTRALGARARKSVRVRVPPPAQMFTQVRARICLSLGWRVALPGEKPRSPVVESTRQLRLTNGLEAADVVG
jgi:hypothetical protein